MLEFGGTTSFEKHWPLRNKRILISQGAGRSGKTFTLLQLLILLSINNPKMNLRFSIVGNTFPNLKKGAIRDFQTIMLDLGLWDDTKWNKSESIYYHNGNIIEFFSADQPGKVRGPQRDFLFINECNNISWETVRQLMLRTAKQIFLDFNPEEEFWVHEEIMNNPAYSGKWGFVKTTMFDNEKLDPNQRADMLAMAETDPWFKQVYILGEVGRREGAILPNYKLIPEISELHRQKGKRLIGVDFGWNDPTTVIDCYFFGNQTNPIQDIFIDQIYYAGETMIEKFDKILKPHYPTLIIADNARPDLINELSHRGNNIMGATSKEILWGLELLKRANIHITERSVDVVKEFRNYIWATDKTGKSLNIPIDKWNHSIDAIRYCAIYLAKLAQNNYINKRTPSKIKKL